MKSIVTVMSSLLLITCITHGAQNKIDSANKAASVEEQKRRDADAQKYRNMVETLGGKHLESHAKPQPDNKQSKL